MLRPLRNLADEVVDLSLKIATGNQPLTRAVVRCLDRPEERTEQMQKGRQRVLERFTYEHNAEAYENIYLSLVDD